MEDLFNPKEHFSSSMLIHNITPVGGHYGNVKVITEDGSKYSEPKTYSHDDKSSRREQIVPGVFVNLENPHVTPHKCNLVTGSSYVKNVECSSSECGNPDWWTQQGEANKNHLGCWKMFFGNCQKRYYNSYWDCKRDQSVWDQKNKIRTTATRVEYPGNTVYGKVFKAPVGVFDLIGNVFETAFNLFTFQDPTSSGSPPEGTLPNVNYWDIYTSVNDKHSNPLYWPEKQAFRDFGSNRFVPITEEEAAGPIPTETKSVTNAFPTGSQKGIDAIMWGTNWSNFCQYGDNVLEHPECKVSNKWGMGNPTSVARNHALSYVCNKVPGDPIRPGKTATEYYFTKPGCDTYCMQDENNCKLAHNKYCSDNSNWPDALNKCKSYLKEFWDPMFVEPGCKDTLLGKSTDPIKNATQNVWGREGCGSLCNSDGIEKNKEEDINYGWCNEIRGEYCTDSKSNMFTEKCFTFCKAHPEKCQSKLKEWCQDDPGFDEMSIEEKEAYIRSKGVSLRDQTGLPGGHAVEDWCGCMQSKNFYNTWRDMLSKVGKTTGLNLDVLLQNTAPHCSYPSCKAGSIKTTSQVESLRAGECGGDCINAVVVELGDKAQLGELSVDQKNQCNNEIEQMKNPSGPSAPYQGGNDNVSSTTNTAIILSDGEIAGIAIALILIAGYLLISFLWQGTLKFWEWKMNPTKTNAVKNAEFVFGIRTKRKLGKKYSRKLKMPKLNRRK